MSKSVIVLLGENNTRKSSVIRCLTGADARASVHEIALADGGYLPLYVHVRSIQEHVGQNAILPAQLVAEFDGSGYRNFLIPLHDAHGRAGQTGQAYVDALMDAGYLVPWVLSLGVEAAPAWVWSRAQRVGEFWDSREMPCTATAAAIRRMVGWA
ncbi:MAG: hypothetical protein NBV67_15435 [Tagaea sp.]|nr:hypothetical protein [Tagaea sp.]